MPSQEADVSVENIVEENEAPPEVKINKETEEVVETTVANVKVDDDGLPAVVNEYRLLDLLGEGAFSKVFKCEKKIDQQSDSISASTVAVFAMKIFCKSVLKRKREFKRVNGKMVASNAFQKVQKEVAILKKLRHNNLTKLYEVIDNPAEDKMFLILELVNGGQVMDWDPENSLYRASSTNGPISETEAQKCVTDIVLALEYLHTNNICHRDIKPENVLATAEFGYKLADFGVAHMFDDEENGQQLKNTEGTYHFLAPECTTGGSYDPFKVDIWALGITLYSLIYGTVPFGANSEGGLTGVMESIRSADLVFPGNVNVSDNCIDLLKKMLDRDVDSRISLANIQKHPWIHKHHLTRGVSYPPPEVIDVSLNEINLAFTPVNNFILMAKIKMKFGQRVMQARRSLDKKNAAVVKEIVKQNLAEDALNTVNEMELNENSQSTAKSETNSFEKECNPSKNNSETLEKENDATKSSILGARKHFDSVSEGEIRQEKKNKPCTIL